MLKTYLKTAWRNIARTPGYSTLNILGLAIGAALMSRSYLAFLVFFFIAYAGMMIYAGPTIAFMQSRLNSRMHATGSAGLPRCRCCCGGSGCS